VLDRLTLHEDQVLAFLDDLTILSTSTKSSAICAASRSSGRSRTAFATTSSPCASRTVPC